MSDNRELYIGLISGTSADAIDAVLVDFSGPHPHYLHQIAYPIDPTVKTRLYELMVPGGNEIDRMGVLDRQLGELFAGAVEQLLSEARIPAAAIQAIGSHGQTIRHRPPGELAAAFTLQIGDPNIIAERSGITTVADFRRRDMAASGQGAPLVPAFHRAVFHAASSDRVILNIGGIANVTFLPRQGAIIGFDTGPGNGLMDGWIREQRYQAYDANGEWAAQGRVDSGLLQTLLAHPYFAQPAPKSTGREMFTMAWLHQALNSLPAIDPVDVQATLLELTAASIASHIRDYHHVAGQLEPGQLEANQLDERNQSHGTATEPGLEIYICGGGAHNSRLMARLQSLLPEHRLGTTGELGIPPDWVEAGAFAWLARQTLARQPGNVPSVTGAERPVILGSVYYG